MEFPADTIHIPSEALKKVMGIARMIRVRTDALSTKSLSGTVGIADILSHGSQLLVWKTELQTLAATPGLADHAKAQFNDATYDIVTKFNTMVARLDETTTWLHTNIPRDGNGYALDYTINSSFVKVPRVFTSVQLAPMRAVLAALSATISVTR